MPLIIDGYQVDAELSSDHEFVNEVTEHPVETGADVTDHSTPKAISVSVEGVVSDTPVGNLAAKRLSDGAGTPSDDALARLLALRESREPITIETSLRVYDNMMLEQLTTSRDASTGDALRFRATFKQLQLVTNRRTTILVAAPRSRRRVDRGAKPSPFAPTDAPPPAAKTDASTATLRALE